MTTSILPYVTLAGEAMEAIEFYKSALGAEVETLMRFKDSPEELPEEHRYPGMEEDVMHATLKIGEATLMISDGCHEKPSLDGVSLMMSTDTIEAAESRFESLSTGGTIVMPLEETFWSKRFGMVTDRFGVSWMISVDQCLVDDPPPSSNAATR